MNKDRHILSATKIDNESSFWKYKLHAHIRGGSSWRGPQMRVGLSTAAILGEMSGYFFGHFRDKASNIIMAKCHPSPVPPS